MRLSAMTIVGQNYYRRKGRFYGCAYYKTRGSSICQNSLLVEQEYLDRIVLQALQDALSEEMLKVAVAKALSKHRAEQGTTLDRRTEIERELSLIQAHGRHLAEAIAKGQAMDPLLEQLKAEEARKKALIQELEVLVKAEQLPVLDDARLKRELKTRLADTKALLSRHVAGARRLLRTLLEQPLRCEAIRTPDRQEYRVTGNGSYLPLLPASLAPLSGTEETCSVVRGVPNGIRTRVAGLKGRRPRPG